MRKNAKAVIWKNNKNFIAIFNLLKKNYPDAKCTLDYKNPLQLLVATILSAQCTDARVNKITPALFDKYKSVNDFADSELIQLEKLIHSTGFYHNKAKNIQATCRKIKKEFKGRVPKKMAQLLVLPGVARKTANVVLFNAFGISDGLAVDTHVTRLAHRLGLSSQKTAEKIENDLMTICPQKKWGMLSHYLIAHGRKICVAKKPDCRNCCLRKKCPSAFAFNKNMVEIK